MPSCRSWAARISKQGTPPPAPFPICLILKNVSGVRDARSQAKIKGALMQAAKDENRLIRTSAVEGLAKIPGPDVTVLLRELAERDPYQLSRESGHPGIFPVRQAARKALVSQASHTTTKQQ